MLAAERLAGAAAFNAGRAKTVELRGARLARQAGASRVSNIKTQVDETIIGYLAVYVSR